MTQDTHIQDEELFNTLEESSPVWYATFSQKSKVMFRGWILNSLKQARQDERKKVVDELSFISIERAHTYASENADMYRAYDNGQAMMLQKVKNFLTKDTNNDTV